MTSDFLPRFTEADLREAAGQPSFQRGLGYLGNVRDLGVRGDKVTATVRGTDDYIVIVSPGRSGRISGACDCPHAAEGFFCKHCVAVGVAYLRSPAPAGPGTAGPGTAGPGTPGLGTPGLGTAGPGTAEAAALAPGLLPWLGTLSYDELTLLVLDQVVEDADWRLRLELRAASARGDDEVVRAQLARILDPADFGEYGHVSGAEARRYASRVTAAADAVADLAAAGCLAGAVETARLAIDLVTEALAHATDPSGVIRKAAADLMTSHEAACQACPDAQETAVASADQRQARPRA